MLLFLMLISKLTASTTFCESQPVPFPCLRERAVHQLVSLDVLLFPHRGKISLTFLLELLDVAYTLVFLPSCIAVTALVLFSALMTGAYRVVSPVQTRTSAQSG